VATDNIPAGFQRWPMHWFQCPSCGHRAHTSVAQVPVPHRLRTLYQFWCAKCGGYSVLKYPKRKGWTVLITLALVVLAFVAFAPNWNASGMAAFITFPIAWFSLNRLMNEYVPDLIEPGRTSATH